MRHRRDGEVGQVSRVLVRKQRQGKGEISYLIMICGIAIAVTTLLFDRGEDLSESGKPGPRLAKADPRDRLLAVERQQRGEDNGARRPERMPANDERARWHDLRKLALDCPHAGIEASMDRPEIVVVDRLDPRLGVP